MDNKDRLKIKQLQQDVNSLNELRKLDCAGRDAYHAANAKIFKEVAEHITAVEKLMPSIIKRLELLEKANEPEVIPLGADGGDGVLIR